MRKSYLKKKCIYAIIILALCIVVLLFVRTYFNNNSLETFSKDDNDVIYKGNPDNKIIAFTCNVDWGNDLIQPMLDIFKKYDIKITFFVTGTWAQKNPELLKAIHEEGHEIGNHGFFHRDYSKLSYELNKEEILKADKSISKILGVKAKYFAPPSGSYSNNTLRAAKDLNYKTVMWTIDTIDWRKDSTKDKIVHRVLSKTSNGAIVLMHPKEETVKALPVIIKSLKENGYNIGKVSDITR